MTTIFIIGNIASGKSCACSYLERRGAQRIDLDELAKSLYQPGSQLVADIVDEFGWGVLDSEGGIDRAALARCAFASPEATQRLDDIVHPELMRQLGLRLVPANCCSTMVPAYPLTVVEVSAPRGFTEAFALGELTVAITAPLEVRRERAIARGMAADDFERRAEVQPTEDAIRAMADVVIDNAAGDDSLFSQLDAIVANLGVSGLRPASPKGPTTAQDDPMREEPAYE